MGEYIGDKAKMSVSHTPMSQKFCQELKTATQEHFRDLQEVIQMPNVNLPRWYLITKRSMDIFVGIVGLLLLSPLFLVVAALIKIDSHGPVFFTQERVGKNGKLFKMYKFRTMVADAERKTGPVWAVKNDPRLTFLGRFLRNSKIDEFPQFMNMIKGDMTMVGPRPERPFFVSYFIKNIPGYARRLEVLPGLTGLAQLKNGYDCDATDVVKKLIFDVTYMEHMSLSTDLRLLAETSWGVLKGKV
jgi:lipopolysaccharide/colanic/teichoic acid biosynthesis glycosyltransferase